MRLNKGSVLISALLMTALAALISTQLIADLHKQIQISEKIETNEYLYRLMQRFQYQAVDILFKYNSKEQWMPEQFQPIRQENTVMIGSWQDQQGLFNINAVKKPEGQAVLKALIQVAQPTLKEEVIKKTMEKIEAYLDEVGLFVSVSELRSLDVGMDEHLFSAIQPYLSALPIEENDPEIMININGVSEEDPLVLVAVLDKKNRSKLNAQRLSVCRKMSKASFISCAERQGMNVIKERVIDKSRYFLAKGIVTTGYSRKTFYTLLERESKQPRVKVLWQSIDTL